MNLTLNPFAHSLLTLAAGTLAAQGQFAWTPALLPVSAEVARGDASRHGPAPMSAPPPPPVGGGSIGSALGPAPQVYPFSVNQGIPDGDLSGSADTRTLPPASGPIHSVAVTLLLTPLGEGGFVGDLYATLAHEGGGYGVLLNRLGRGASSPFGYSDGVAVQVTLADDAPADIHQYRLTLTGSEAIPLAGALTGRWQPDGRTADPLSVTPASFREANLDSFAGVGQEGRWTLFIADVSGGGEYRLDSWALSVTPVPEPGPAGAVLALAALGWVTLCSSRRSRNGPSPEPSPRGPSPEC